MYQEITIDSYCHKHACYFSNHQGCASCLVELHSFKTGKVDKESRLGLLPCGKNDFCCDFKNKDIVVRCVYSFECEIEQGKQKI
jgi:hypothetical protein